MVALAYQDAVALRDEYVERLMDVPGVVGVGVGPLRPTKGKRFPSSSQGFCVRVYLESADPSIKRQLAKMLRGLPLDFEVTGAVVASDAML